MSILTYDVLKSLGFKDDKSIISDPPGGLSFDFGNFKLSAVFGINRWIQEAVLLCGVMSTSRSIAYINTEMPLEVDSREQGLAWITWCLDKHADGGVFEPIQPLDWLIEGRQYFHILPWERERTAYESRPHCWVQRDWAKVAIRKLSEQIAISDNEAPVTFQFDGEIITIRCGTVLVATIPANGKKWACQYLLKAGNLRRLPQRLMSEKVEFSVWNSGFKIGRFCYKDVVIVENVDEL